MDGMHNWITGLLILGTLAVAFEYPIMMIFGTEEYESLSKNQLMLLGLCFGSISGYLYIIFDVTPTKGNDHVEPETKENPDDDDIKKERKPINSVRKKRNRKHKK